MFGTIRRHQNWLWMVIITVIILSFVVFFAPDVKLGTSDRAVTSETGSIDGKPIPLEEFRPAYTEAILNYFMRNGGKWPESGQEENLRLDAARRVFLFRKMRELNIHVSNEAIGRVARERLGENVMANLSTFEKEYLASGNINLEQLTQYLKHEAGIQQLLQAASASAKLVNPQEAEALFKEEHEKMATEVAVFSASNYVGKVNVTPEAITNHYTRQQAQYRVPERIQVAYVEFPAASFYEVADKELASNTNLNAMLDELYLRQGPENFKDTNGVKMPEDKAKQMIKQDARQGVALREARRKANDFGTELYNKEVTKLADFEKIAAAHNLQVKSTQPFDRLKGLEDSEFPPAFRQKALTLAEQQPVAVNPIVGSNAVYVIALKAKVTSELPPLEKVREQVTKDYRQFQAADLGRKEGNAFHTAVTNALAQKRSFADAAAQANVKVISVPPFSAGVPLTNAPAGLNPRMLQNVAQSLKPGEVSPFIPTAEGGMVVYLKERIPVTPEEMKKELPEFVGRLRFYRQNEAFSQWFRKQAEQARLVLPQRETVSAANTPGGPPPPPAAKK